jgi:hypothetical protein
MCVGCTAHLQLAYPVSNCFVLFRCPIHRVHRVAISTFSGVHSIMVKKFAQPGEGGGASPSPFTISSITNKVVVYAPADRADKLPPISPLPLYDSVVLYVNCRFLGELVAGLIIILDRIPRIFVSGCQPHAHVKNIRDFLPLMHGTPFIICISLYENCCLTEQNTCKSGKLQVSQIFPAISESTSFV